jgi:hypothetical protein
VGGTFSPLIVVGNAQYDNSRHPSSQFRDVDRRGILSIYNIGTNVVCAVPNPARVPAQSDWGQSWNFEPAGTSQATAITAGMLAYYLSDPQINALFRAGGLANVGMTAKTYLLNVARGNKGADAGQGDGIPRAALGDLVPCAGGPVSRPIIPEVQNPRPTDPKILSTSLITEGQAVVYNPLVSLHCYFPCYLLLMTRV